MVRLRSHFKILYFNALSESEKHESKDAEEFITREEKVMADLRYQ